MRNSVSLADVKASDWLAGTIAAAYGVDDPDVAADVERLARDVAIREHAARALQVHPASLRLTEVEALRGRKSNGNSCECRRRKCRSTAST